MYEKYRRKVVTFKGTVYKDYEVDTLGNVFYKGSKLIASVFGSGTVSRPFTYIIVEREEFHIVANYVLVASTFIKNDDPVNKVDVHHMNGNHRDCRVQNLMWITKEEHQRIHGILPKRYKVSKRGKRQICIGRKQLKEVIGLDSDDKLKILKKRKVFFHKGFRVELIK